MPIFDKKTFFLLIAAALLLQTMRSMGLPDTLDAKLYYSGDQARALLDGFTEAQLQNYFINELFDLAFITSYTALLILLFKRTYSNHSWIVALPLFVGLADLVETGVIISILKWNGSRACLDWLGWVTFAKWTLGAVAGVLVVVGLIQVKWAARKSS